MENILHDNLAKTLLPFGHQICERPHTQRHCFPFLGVLLPLDKAKKMVLKTKNTKGTYEILVSVFHMNSNSMLSAQIKEIRVNKN
ncbi:MAG: hypothetical protein ACRDDA_11945 [Aeromonas sp.]